MIGISFTYKDFSVSEDRTQSTFRYQIVTDESVFTLKETLRWPQPLASSIAIDSLHVSLHMALGMSYYKAFIPPVIEHPYGFTETEAAFWNEVYVNGLGEFLYTNNLDPSVLPEFQARPNAQEQTDESLDLQPNALLGIGGGKDSIVAGELLKEINIQPTGFVLATKQNTGVTEAVVEIMQTDILRVERTIDPQILEINDMPGAYNGHIPISLIFGLVGSVLAVNSQSAYVVVANESSASIPQTQWHNRDINHQWSKSLTFEKLFQDYIHHTVSPELQYFSAIRPLSSVGVARIFANYPQYFEHFTSDNSLFKIEQSERSHPRWGGDSSKSLSSYMLLAPWLKTDDLERIFGKHFLDDEALKDMFTNLLGKGATTILDCVGTPEELTASLAQLKSYGKLTDTKLMQYASQTGFLDNAPPLTDFLKLSDHAIPQAVSGKLIKAMGHKL